MSRRLRYLLCVCTTWQKSCSEKYVVGNDRNKSFTFPLTSGKRSLHLIQKFHHPCVWNITRTSLSLWMSMRRSWMVQPHSLTSWQKAVSPGTFYAMQLSAWSPQQNDIMASLKQQVAKRIFWTPWFNQDWAFGHTCRSKLLLSWLYVHSNWLKT